MVTPLGPVSIPVTLNTAKALQELDALEKRVKEIGLVQAAQGDFQERSATKAVETAEKAEVATEKLGRQAKAGRFGSGVSKIAIAVGAAADVAVMAETALAAGGAAMKELGKSEPGAAFNPIDEMRKTILDEVGKQMQALGDAISDLRVKFTAFAPAAAQAKELALGRAVLGGDVAATARDFGTLYKVAEAQGRLERQREKMVPESVAAYLAKWLTGGAKH